MTTARTARACELLDHYRPGAFLLATPDHTLLATGEASAADGPLVGMLPFDIDRPAHLLTPAHTTWAGPVHDELGPPDPLPLTRCRMRPEPEPAVFEAGVADAVRALNGGDLRKVVLARTLRLDLDEPLDVPTVLRNLAADNPTGYTFAVPLPGGRTLIGATPEMLVTRRGRTVVSNPLAGTMPRDADPEADQANAATLLASGKDRREHAVVIDYVADTLRPFCRTLTVPDAPSLIGTSAVWQLSTRITGELADPEVTALDLARALHPTPAICGTPTAEARAAIDRIESFDRGFYAGALGWCDADGDGEWYIGIRSAELSADGLLLYAGAGIMPDSRPASELAETSAKFRTLLRGMGLGGAL
ncbi:isochorismate synthase [Herbihabitans rhizosphaerae]|uniref:isochorismate synthase n=1 Tax=Herbihabitans rhizosphaerae TaxID=1872711 RepID=A0A4Q7L696_9PSEU|nr:isochorismate synthase [Herbihabitans rhizosphaerae]RZS44776.1 isochorismate synthase [Herbihabitans rhizosphaerae]